MTIAVHTNSGPIDVECFAHERGLAVTATTDGSDRRRGKYRITHTASGLGIGFFLSKAGAMKAFRALLALDGIEWTGPADALATPANAMRVREAIGQV